MQNCVTVYGGGNYALVYDYNYYVNKYSDIKNAFGNNLPTYYKHYIEFGRRENRTVDRRL